MPGKITKKYGEIIVSVGRGREGKKGRSPEYVVWHCTGNGFFFCVREIEVILTYTHTYPENEV